jgi:putative membrane protein
MRVLMTTGSARRDTHLEAGIMDLVPFFDTMTVLAAFNDGDRGDFWFFWPLIPLFWIIVVALVLRFVVFRGRRGWSQPSPMDRARGILAERYARGEIDGEEYRRRSDELS